MITQHNINLGDQTVDLKKVNRDGNHYLVIHGNEYTAKNTLTLHTQTTLSSCFIIQSEQRDITIDGLTLDPNRIFTSKGIQNELKKAHPTIPENQLKILQQTLEQQRDQLLLHLTPLAPFALVALHNNQFGYTMRDEIRLHSTYHINTQHKINNFFLCTRKTDFDQLKLFNYNAVLLENEQHPDDGSLSWYALKHNIRYINIETALDDAKEQEDMLNAVLQLTV